MSTPRFYQNKPLSLGDCALDEAATHHMIHVLRLKLGAEVIIFNGNGDEFKGILRQIHKKSAVIELQQQYPVHNESPLALHLVQAISRKDHMDLTVQKAVELGVTEITPVVSDFSNIKQSGDQFNQKEQHWQKIIISATQQSGRTILTQLNPIISFREALQKVTTEQRLFLSPRATESCKKIFMTKPQSTALFIGCEGGFSYQEEQAALAAELKAITLGPRILRTETAAIAALSILQYCRGDL
ncbi:MAG: 16S rRNA (uracil(1498)-N(3))-methyltransferase [Gammaproteobacteria bacterium]|nr:16S rRNA (uracil(1498)-N(3))-methyltransferase [Gammaproteobacteria bacterium]